MSATMVRQARILVVDDERMVAQALSLVLSREFAVTTTTQPAQALEWIVSGESFDVILCDVMMPEMNGVELRARIDAIDPDQAARIVFVTGGVLLPHVRALLESVPNAWIEKPIDIDGLRELVRRRVRAVRPSWRAPPRAM
jgi:CheY-like chemotaxis protein